MKGIGVFKQVCLFGLAGFGFFCLVILLLNQWLDKPLIRRMQSILGVECSSKNITDIEDVRALTEIQELVKFARKSVHEDMAGYPYPNGKYNISATKLEDLVMEENGRPVRSVVLSTWRSGSTFFGEILGAHPGNFYFFEPLVHFDTVQIRGPPLASKALKLVRAMLNCEFSGLDEYVTFVQTESVGRPLNKTTYLWDRCNGHNSTCYDHRYLNGMCRLFPFQSMKLLRLRLRVSRDLLADEKLGVRVVLLVRDPRGTLQSSKRRSWCPRSPDCSDPALHCADLVSDYKIARELLKKYPTTFRVIRYEDLSTDPYNQVNDILKFYGRDFHSNVRKFLDTHTTTNVGGPHSTFRDSKTTPFHWRTDSTFEEVEEIQRTCAAAMEHWGYVPAVNATHLREFNPVTDYVLN